MNVDRRVKFSHTLVKVQPKAHTQADKNAKETRILRNCLTKKYKRTMNKYSLLYAHWQVFFFNDTATTEIYTNLNTLSLHDALPILRRNGLKNIFNCRY